jgi:hypothetical protein
VTAIYKPNEEGNTLAQVRWQMDTPHGWLGAWDRKALEWVEAATRQAQENKVDLYERVEELLDDLIERDADLAERFIESRLARLALRKS